VGKRGEILGEKRSNSGGGGLKEKEKDRRTLGKKKGLYGKKKSVVFDSGKRKNLRQGKKGGGPFTIQIFAKKFFKNSSEISETHFRKDWGVDNQKEKNCLTPAKRERDPWKGSSL